MQKTAYEMRISDWSSDVCSSDRSMPWLPAERVSVIYNGVDYDAIAAASPAQLPIPRATVVVGFIGRLEPRKGIPDLLDAWRSEERRVGKECVSECRFRWSTDH